MALIGERDISKPAHAGIEAAFALYGRGNEAGPEFRWLGTAMFDEPGTEGILERVSGIWCVPGSPYASTDGALRAIRFARERSIPFLGTCGGFQHALMEYARNALGVPAEHRELDPAAPNALIVPLACSLVGTRAKVCAVPGAGFAETVGSAESIEEFNCSFGLEPSFEPVFAGSDLEFIARDEAGQPRAFRLRKHPFFVGTLFQPERRALEGSLHPIVRAFLAAAGHVTY